jgi:hypothetical protein
MLADMSPGETQPVQTPPGLTVTGTRPTKLDFIEQIAKIFSLLAIPIIIPIALAIFSAKVQEGAQKEAINRDYVQLALSVLKEKKEDVNPGLRNWAADLLAEHSPTKFAPEVIADLKSGAVSFPVIPDIVGGVSSGGKIATMSPNRQMLAVGENTKIALTDVQTGDRRILSISGAASAVSLDFSPDSTFLAVGGSDGSVHLLNVKTNREVLRLKINEPVLAVKIAPSKIYVISVGTIYFFSRKGEAAGSISIPAAPKGLSATAQ